MEVEKGLEDLVIHIVVLMLHADICQLSAFGQTLEKVFQVFPVGLSHYKTVHVRQEAAKACG